MMTSCTDIYVEGIRDTLTSSLVDVINRAIPA